MLVAKKFASYYCKVFDGFLSKDVILYGSMIEGYAQEGYCFCALDLFVDMVCKDMKLKESHNFECFQGQQWHQGNRIRVFLYTIIVDVLKRGRIILQLSYMRGCK